MNHWQWWFDYMKDAFLYSKTFYYMNDGTYWSVRMVPAPLWVIFSTKTSKISNKRSILSRKSSSKAKLSLFLGWSLFFRGLRIENFDELTQGSFKITLIEPVFKNITLIEDHSRELCPIIWFQGLADTNIQFNSHDTRSAPFPHMERFFLEW